MAEAALFSLTVSLLSKLAKPAFKNAYERIVSIWGASKELENLRRTVETIQASLSDAEKRAASSALVNDWIKRTKEVLYEVDDLFDEVSTTDLLKQRKGSGVLGKVQTSFSKLNPVSSNDSIAQKVKAVRKKLAQIHTDMGVFRFVECAYEGNMLGGMRGVQSGWYVERKEVFGRKSDHETIRGYLLDESTADRDVSVVAIVGIGGMGKTTLAQLVYNDLTIQNRFGKRWWAWISKAADDMEVIGKIFQSMTGDLRSNLTMCQFETGIRESLGTDDESASMDEECTTTNGRFLLVLDDLWEEDRARGKRLRSLLSSANAKGSKILVTTRFPSVAEAMEADPIYVLNGLSWEASWDLFKNLAFTQENENDPEFKDLGEKIVRKCANVPLAIKSIASLLFKKDKIRDWRQIEGKELSQIELTDDSIISALKLSYDHLPSHLKQCFAYCYLFPKNYIFCKEELIYLWIAQGYVKQENYTTMEEAGDACFMELLRMSFFQEAQLDKHVDEIVSCKMHSLMHDLAQRVAGEECIVLTQAETSRPFYSNLRHLSVGYGIGVSWNIPQPLLKCSGLRSSLFKYEGSLDSLLLDELPSKYKFLRALNLGHQKIEKVSSSIGELKHVRYLNLSRNKFTNLPDSMTKLVNLHTLDISCCDQLEALPIDFRKLINLVHLDNKECKRLRHMPPRFGDLPSLRRLSYFKVGKAISDRKYSWLDAVSGLKLMGELMIRFDDNIEGWNGDECWQLPSTIQVLAIEKYPETRMPHWGQLQEDNASLICKLQVVNSFSLKILPPFKSLPNLKALELSDLDQLEYIEEEEKGVVAVEESPIVSLPLLKELKLCNLPNLVGWSRGVEVATNKDSALNRKKKYPVLNCPHPPHQMPSFSSHQMPSFSSLVDLKIQRCRNLKSLPLSPCLEALELEVINENVMQQFLFPPTSSLKSIVIWTCDGLERFPGKDLTCLQFLDLKYCNNLQHIELALPQCNVIEELKIQYCPQLVLWGENRRVVWESLPNLRVLSLDDIPNDDSLPICLRNLQSCGKLDIKKPL